MNKRLWSYVFDNLSKNWVLDAKKCFLCLSNYSTTLCLTNTTSFPFKDKIAAKQRSIHLCKSCLLDSSFNERLDIFAALAVRRSNNSRKCHVCERVTMRYIIVPSTFTNEYLCFDCFVYGNDKVWNHTPEVSPDSRKYHDAQHHPLHHDDYYVPLDDEIDPHDDDYIYIDNYKEEDFSDYEDDEEPVEENYDKLYEFSKNAPKRASHNDDLYYNDAPIPQQLQPNEVANKRKQPVDEDDGFEYLLEAYDSNINPYDFSVIQYDDKDPYYLNQQPDDDANYNDVNDDKYYQYGKLVIGYK